jgi:hypothetical protein
VHDVYIQCNTAAAAHYWLLLLLLLQRSSVQQHCCSLVSVGAVYTSISVCTSLKSPTSVATATAAQCTALRTSLLPPSHINYLLAQYTKLLKIDCVVCIAVCSPVEHTSTHTHLDMHLLLLLLLVLLLLLLLLLPLVLLLLLCLLYAARNSSSSSSNSNFRHKQ